MCARVSTTPHALPSSGIGRIAVRVESLATRDWLRIALQSPGMRNGTFCRVGDQLLDTRVAPLDCIWRAVHGRGVSSLVVTAAPHGDHSLSG
jgi:hypothetical protein